MMGSERWEMEMRNLWVRTGLCEPALVAALLLILWIRMLPQLLRGRLEKLVPQNKLLVTLMFKISGREPLASDMAATRLPSPEEDRCLWEVSRKIVDRRLSSESRLPGPSAQGPGDRRDHCDHKACVCILYRWMRWPVMLHGAFACGTMGFATPRWETLKMHYQKLYPRGTTLPTSNFWLQARPAASKRG